MQTPRTTLIPCLGELLLLASYTGLSLAGLSVSGQAQQRGPLRGSVRDAAGRAVQGAKVELISRPRAAILDSGPLDRVHAVTNAQGRFRASILRDRDYSAWAVLQKGELRYFTAIADGLRTQSRVRLQLDKRARHPLQVKITGLAAWKRRGPLRFFAMDPAPENVLREPLEVDSKGRFLFPELPGERGWIEVDDRDGRPIWQVHLSPQDFRAGSDIGTEAVLEVPIAPPKILRIDAVETSLGNGPKGMPVNAAEVLYGRNAGRIPLVSMGELDGQGRLELELAYTSQKAAHAGAGFSCANSLAQAALVLRKADRADAFGNLQEKGAALDDDGVPCIKFKLFPGAEAVGQLMLDAERPAKNARLLVYSSLYGKSGGGQIACAPQLHFCDAQGRFRIPGRSPAHPFRICVLLDDAQRQKYQPKQARSLAAEFLIAAATAQKGQNELQLGTLRIDQLAKLDIDSFDSDRSPLQAPYFLLGEDSNKAPNWPLRSRGNRRGRIRFLVPSDFAYGVWLESSKGFAMLQGRTGKGPGPDSSKPLEMALDTHKILRFQLVASEGSTLPKQAFLSITQLLARGGPRQLLQRWNISLGLGGRRNQNRYPISTIKDPRVQIRLRSWGFYCNPMPPIPVSKTGSFSVAVPSSMVNLKFAVIAHDGHGYFTSQPGIAWSEGCGVREIEVPAGH